MFKNWYIEFWEFGFSVNEKGEDFWYNICIDVKGKISEGLDIIEVKG
jgi:hypothetical protein